MQNFILSFPDLVKSFLDSPGFFVVKFMVGAYLIVIVIDILLLLILRDVPSEYRTGVKGMNIPTASKGKMRKRWDKVEERLKSGDVSQFKVAIIEADAIADEFLAGIGYKGSNMAERLEQVQPAHMDEHLEALKGAHEIRNKIVHESDYVVDERFAKAVVGVYESFLKYLEFLD